MVLFRDIQGLDYGYFDMTGKYMEAGAERNGSLMDRNTAVKFVKSVSLQNTIHPNCPGALQATMKHVS